MKTRPCIKLRWDQESQSFSSCPYPAMKRKQSCEWHWLQAQSASVQQEYATARLDRFLLTGGSDRIDRVPKDLWPDGERWCAGCQSFVPLFYCRGSRCKSCQSTAAHEQRVQKTYGLEPGEYEALLKLQGGVCYVCRRATTRRLAVDHDHVTGAPRGLLCADPTRGCNLAVLGSLSGPGRDELAQARRLVEYLEHTPYERLRGVPRGFPKVLQGIDGSAMPTHPLDPPF